MKKTTLTLLALLLAFSFSFAQKDEKDDKKKFLTYGLRAGLNMANIKASSGSDDIDNASKPLYHLGGYLKLNVANKLIIQPEMDFSAEGMRVLSSAFTDSMTRLNYLTMPINIVFKPVKFINIQAGPELGFLMSAVSKATGVDEKIPATANFNRGNASFNVGFGITLLKIVNITGTYKYGLTNLNSIKQVGTAGDAVQWFNRTFQISASYNIFGKKGKL